MSPRSIPPTRQLKSDTTDDTRHYNGNESINLPSLVLRLP